MSRLGRPLTVPQPTLAARVPSSGATPTHHVLDTFTDANGTLLTAHTMDVGSGWVAVTGTFDIQTNRAQPVSNNHNDVIRTNATVSDFVVSVIVTVFFVAGIEERPGSAFRISDTNNYWLHQIDGQAQTNDLYEKNAGVFTLRARTAFAFATGTAHTLEATCSGQNITITADGGASASYALAALNEFNTFVALRLGKLGAPASLGRWDDIEVPI